VNEGDEVDLCPVDPGAEAALQIRTTLRAMTRAWMGDLSVGTAQRNGQLTILGPRDLKRRLSGWLRLSPYAPIADARGVHRTRGAEHAGTSGLQIGIPT
jgi:hypothetical protein